MTVELIFSDFGDIHFSWLCITFSMQLEVNLSDIMRLLKLPVKKCGGFLKNTDTTVKNLNKILTAQAFSLRLTRILPLLGSL